jgi:hypothetical protein
METMRSIPILTGLGLALLIAGSQLARADDTAKQAAREAFREGVEHYEAKRFEEAVGAFRSANAIYPAWKIHFNIAQCEAALKRYGLAIDEFERYLAGGGDDVVLARREHVLAELRRLREMVGTVDVQGPPGLSVVIDGIERGTTPLGAGVRVTAGMDHKIEVLSGEHTLVLQQVFVGGGQRVRIEAEAEGIPAAPVAEPASPVEPEPAESAGVEPPEDDVGADGIEPVYFWIGAGATLAFGGVTLAMNFAAESKYEDAEADPSNDALREEGKKLQAVGITFLALTGAAAVTTGILAAFTDFGGEEQGNVDDVAVAPWVGEQGGGLALEGRF